MEKLGIEKYFDLVVTGDDIEGHKPSPEGIDMFIQNFNLDRNKVLMIGDAPADILAARNAGIKCASVLWDSYAREKVLSMNSDYQFETVEELKNFIVENI